jgi:hypothetical protein
MGELRGEMEALQQGLSQFRAPGTHKPATGISEEPGMEVFDPLKKKKEGEKKKEKGGEVFALGKPRSRN